MPQATMALPDTYELSGALDLSKNRTAAIGLSAAAVVSLLPASRFVMWFVAVFRPDATSGEFRLGSFEVLLGLAGLMAATALVMLVHEAVHGLCFRLVTGARPVFGFRVLYAYAAAPNWYIPRDQYLLIGLAPLVLIALAGLALLLIVPSAAIPALALLVVFNAAGAIGDLIAVVLLLTRPRSSLVRDLGDSVAVYQRARPA